MISLKIWPSPLITSQNFCKNSLKQDSFNVTWKVLPLSSQYRPYYEVSTSKKPSLEIHLKIWSAPRIASWNFCKNIEVLGMSLEKLSSYYWVPIINHNIAIFRGGSGPAILRSFLNVIYLNEIEVKKF